LAAAYAEAVSPPTMPAVEVMVTMWPERRLRIAGSTARVTFIGPSSVAASWASICSGGELLEVAGVEVAGVVDEQRLLFSAPTTAPAACTRTPARLARHLNCFDIVEWQSGLPSVVSST
jgi:hypothetical protein